MARKKKAWNMSNPLYRYLHGKGKAKKSRSRGGRMAKKRKGGRRKGQGGMNIINEIFVPAVVGFVGGAAVGQVSDRFAPQVTDYQAPAVGAATGGLAAVLMKKKVLGIGAGAAAGAAGAHVASMLLGTARRGGAAGASGVQAGTSKVYA